VKRLKSISRKVENVHESEVHFALTSDLEEVRQETRKAQDKVGILAVPIAEIKKSAEEAKNAAEEAKSLAKEAEKA
jgi:hypothetical protein